MVKIKRVPDTQDAEGWITPDVFLFLGEMYYVDIHGKVSLIEYVNPNEA